MQNQVVVFRVNFCSKLYYRMDEDTAALLINLCLTEPWSLDLPAEPLVFRGNLADAFCGAVKTPGKITTQDETPGVSEVKPLLKGFSPRPMWKRLCYPSFVTQRILQNF